MKVKPVRSRRFQRVGVDQSETQAFLEHLDLHGYAIAGSVATKNDINRGKILLWDFLEGKGGSEEGNDTGVRRDDVTTWGDYFDNESGLGKYAKRWPGDPQTGIISSNGIGHSPFMWHLRLLPGVSQTFSAIWNVPPQDLITSFDGANAFRPWKYNAQWKTESGWFHVDQNAFNPGKEEKCSVQGLLTLTAADSSTGGLVIVPGSHKHFQEVCERNAMRPKPGLSALDFVPISQNDEAIDHCHLVCADAGDLIVWDSRTIHCNTPAIEEPMLLDSSPKLSLPSDSGKWELIRMAGYICMTPAAWASDEVLKNRWDSYVNNVTTSHWPHISTNRVRPNHLRMNDPNNISLDQQRLIGGSMEPHSTSQWSHTPHPLVQFLKSKMLKKY